MMLLSRRQILERIENLDARSAHTRNPKLTPIQWFHGVFFRINFGVRAKIFFVPCGDGQPVFPHGGRSSIGTGQAAVCNRHAQLIMGAVAVTIFEGRAWRIQSAATVRIPHRTRVTPGSTLQRGAGSGAVNSRADVLFGPTRAQTTLLAHRVISIHVYLRPSAVHFLQIQSPFSLV
jgi:hypothetical protein